MKRLVWLLVIFAVLCGGIAQAQVASGGAGKYELSVASTSINISGTWTCSANSLILVGIGADQSGTGQSISSVSLGGVSLTGLASTIVNVNGQFAMQVFYGYTSSGLTNPSLVATLAQSQRASGVAACLTGTNASSGSPTDGIGTVNAASGNTNAPTVTVTSSSTNNSKYYGFIVAVSGSISDNVNPGANYTQLSTDAYDGGWVHSIAEISTNPVSPAASTAVNGTISSILNWGVAGVEVKVSTGGAAPTFVKRSPIVI